jgi:hypothetical protein
MEVTINPINFTDPFEIKRIFRWREGDTSQRINPEYDDVLAKIQAENEETPEPVYKEFVEKTFIVWEMVEALAEYPYPDDWSGDFKGPKFFIFFFGKPDPYLVLGNISLVRAYWTVFRNTYTTFR